MSATAPMSVPRDRCPGTLRLHAAQDGLLARVRLPGGRIGVPGLRAVAAAARLGNGIVELTARANLQVRGLDATAAAQLAGGFASAGLLPSPGHDRVRNIAAAPLAGRRPGAVAGTDAVVEALDRGLCADPLLTRLPGPFRFAVDDGTATAPCPGADVALLPDGADVLALLLGGVATTLRAGTAAAPSLALDAARAFLAQRTVEEGRVWRIAELERGSERVARALGGRICPDRHGRWGSDVPGLGALRQADGRLALTALAPLGRIDGAGADALAGLAAGTGGEVRIAAGRRVSVVDVEPGDAPGAQAALEGLGLVMAPGSGWEGLSTCAGLGACARARVDVRAAAARRAAVRAAPAGVEHWSACERRCGAREGAGVTVTATAAGILVEDEDGGASEEDGAASQGTGAATGARGCAVRSVDAVLELLAERGGQA